MVQYVKVKLYGRINGEFVANALIVKSPSSAMEQTSRWHLVFRQADRLNIEATTASTLRFGDLTINCNTPGGIGAALIFVGSAYDGFETLLVSERLRTDSIFRNHRVILGDEIFDGNGGIFSVDFDDLFIVEQRESASVSGILIKSAYTQTEIYSGFSGYHHNQHVHSFNTPVNNDKPYRIGVELELYARNRDAYNKITTARTNWFQCERDGSLDQRVDGVSGLGIEMKTIPLRPADATSIDFWSEPMAKLKTLAVSKSYSTTGLHVHISKEILGATEAERQVNLKKLITFYTYHVEDNAAAKEKNKTICGRAEGYCVNPNGAKTELGNFAKMLGFADVAKSSDAWNMMTQGIVDNCRSQRGDINIQHWDDYKTIEFRKGKGAISKKRLAAICAWWEQMCLYCKNTDSTNLSFDDFFAKACHESPAVAWFFMQDDEC